jgi:hypothetical protein
VLPRLSVVPGLQFGSCVAPGSALQSTVPLWLDPERVWPLVDELESARRLVPVPLLSVDDVAPVELLSRLPPIDEHPPSIATAAAAAITIPKCLLMIAPLCVCSPPPAATPM